MQIICGTIDITVLQRGTQTGPRAAVGDVVAIVLIMIIATLVFEMAWRIALALLILGPAAYAAIVAGWFASQAGLALTWSIGIALIAGLLVRWLSVLALEWSAPQISGAWRRTLRSDVQRLKYPRSGQNVWGAAKRTSPLRTST